VSEQQRKSNGFSRSQNSTYKENKLSEGQVFIAQCKGLFTCVDWVASMHKNFEDLVCRKGIDLAGEWTSIFL